MEHGHLNGTQAFIWNMGINMKHRHYMEHRHYYGTYSFIWHIDIHLNNMTPS